MEVATSVLYLEAALEDLDPSDPQLTSRTLQLAGRIERVRAGGHSEPLEPWMEDLYRRVSDRQTMGTVVDELRSHLSELEKSLDQYFRRPAEKGLLRTVPTQLMQMRGVFSVLGLDQAAHTVQRMRDDVEAMLVSTSPAEEMAGFDALGNNLGALGFLIDMLGYQPALAKRLFVFDAEAGELKPLMGRQATDSVADEGAARPARRPSRCSASRKSTRRSPPSSPRSPRPPQGQGVAASRSSAARPRAGPPRSPARARCPTPRSPSSKKTTCRTSSWTKPARWSQRPGRHRRTGQPSGRHRRTHHPAPRVPHAQGQLAHGRPHRLRRCRLVARAGAQHLAGRPAPATPELLSATERTLRDFSQWVEAIASGDAAFLAGRPFSRVADALLAGEPVPAAGARGRCGATGGGRAPHRRRTRAVPPLPARCRSCRTCPTCRSDSRGRARAGLPELPAASEADSRPSHGKSPEVRHARGRRRLRVHRLHRLRFEAAHRRRRRC
jgi:chemosensory pili system protein ChpA (sensor histidine kinase/response regulator)